MLGNLLQVAGLKDINCTEDIPETSPTIEGNALQKARFVRDNYNVDCFSEDTGLEIMALNGEPGVYSARYAGPERDADANMDLALQKLNGQSDRSARFKTVIALVMNGQEYTFEGICNGRIRMEKSGKGGFGYDPIFEPEGFDQTFAEMTTEEKNAVSHRGRAVRKLVAFLKEHKP